MNNMTLQEVWTLLKDTPVDCDDNIEISCLHFEAGTPVFEIWHWLEDRYNVSVADLLYK